MNDYTLIISHGACLATTTRVAVDDARRGGEIVGVQWGAMRFFVGPKDSVEDGIAKFHAAARVQRGMVKI